MSGHSKWSTIKHKKAANDSKRGRLFSKLVKEITAAARLGGGDVDMNPRLRTAIATAKSSNVPSDNIEKAILRGTGDLEGESIEEVVYEGYGPGGVALMIEVITDNKNRAIAEIRHTLGKYEGRIGERGCVAWGFDKCGLIVVDANTVDEDDLFLAAADAGAEDITSLENVFEIITPFDQFDKVVTAIQSTDADVQLAELSMIPQNTVKLEGKVAERMLKLMDALDEIDDVQKVYANFDIPDDILEAAA